MNAFFTRIQQPRYKLVLVLVLVAFAFVLGYLLRGGTSQTAVPESEEQLEEAKVEVWTCAMHPHIRQPKAGKCPLCGMDLVAATSGELGGEYGGLRELTLSPEAIALAEIEVVPVERRTVSAQIRMVGKIDYDETRIAYITARFPGRLDRLFVDYTGIPVRKGDHMAVIYSPELLTAQAELVQALRTVKELAGSDLSSIKETALETVEAAREKLRLWGLTTEQIEQIQTRGTPSDHMTIYAPMSGIVIHKNAVEGMYVNTGSRIYTIADLSQVWARLDAYESDIIWLKYGQDVALETESYPGEVFMGKIAFIDPVFDAKTRTVKVRVNLPNPDGRLMPEMFVRAVVRSEVAAGGKVVEPDLIGKWMCPMHPEIVKDDPGTCDICEMPLAKTESLGYVSADAVKGDAAPLVIPAFAPLITGERAVVYIQVPDKEGVFEGREIVLGPRAGDYYIVDEGLDEGELVVVNGNFKIDSALQILAKPSMMSPQGGAPAPGHHHGAAMPSASATRKAEAPEAFLTQLQAMYEAYLKLQDALASDSKDKAVQALKGVRKALAAVQMKLLEGEAHMRWVKHQANLGKTIETMTDAASIEMIRAGFAPMSEELAAVIRAFGVGIEEPIYLLRCPMAFDGRGARWLQKTKDTRNPYFGAAMLQCGKVVETLSASTSEEVEKHQHD
jgi:Cu(I)/Ag(I) efflux system membrane fusion protein